MKAYFVVNLIEILVVMHTLCVFVNVITMYNADKLGSKDGDYVSSFYAPKARD